MGVGVVAYIIAIVWSFNIKKIAFGTWEDRFLYASGSSTGSMISLWISLHLL